MPRTWPPPIPGQPARRGFCVLRQDFSPPLPARRIYLLDAQAGEYQPLQEVTALDVSKFTERLKDSDYPCGEVFSKKTRKTPEDVIQICQRRFKDYDKLVRE